MGKAKIALRTVWNVFAFLLIGFVSMSCAVSYDIVLTATFRTFLLPMVVLLLIYHIYICVMYYIYCHKHKDDVICFANKDKSKTKTVITVVVLVTSVILWTLYGISLMCVFTKGEQVNAKTSFLDNLNYAYTANIELTTKQELNIENQYPFLSMYAVTGELTTVEATSNEAVAQVSFEYGENLPFYVSSFVYNEMVDSMSTSFSYHVPNGEPYRTTHNEIEVDGVKLAYRYIKCERNNFINVCIKDNNKVLYIDEDWEAFVEIDPEARINEWLEKFKSI